MSSYLDEYQPRRQAFTSADSPSFQSLVGPGDTRRSASLTQTHEQLRAYRFWNYVAIQRITAKLAAMVPMVSLPTRGRGAVTQRFLSFEQRQHLRTNYSGVLQSVADDLMPVGESHPLVALLNRPNPRDWWGMLVTETHLYWQLTGRFYWWVVPNGLGKPAEIHCVPVDLIEPLFDQQGVQYGWRIQRPGAIAPLELPVDEVIEGKFPSPLGKADAQSPSQAGDLWIDNAIALEQSRGHAMRNMIRPSVLLSMDSAVYPKPPDQEVLDRLKEKFASRVAGVAKTGEPLVAPPGITVTPWGSTPAEMDYPESSDQLRDSILALRGVPRALAGMSHDLNRASVEGAEAIFCDYTINPLAAMFAGFIQHRLAIRFDPRLVVWFDDVKPREAEQEREEWKLDFSMGAATPDERRTYRGQEPFKIPGVTDVGYLPSSLVPVDDVEDEVLPPPGQGGREPASNSDKGDEEQPASDEEDAPAKRQRLFSVRQSSRTERRSARAVAGWQRLHTSQEKAGKQTVATFWKRVIPKVVKRLKDSTSGRMFPTAQELIPHDFKDEFNRLWVPRWNELAWYGVEFEQAWIGRAMDNAQSFHGLFNAWSVMQASVPVPERPEPPSSIRVEVSDQTRKALGDWLDARSVGVWSLVAETTKKRLEGALSAGIVAGDDLDGMVQRVQKELTEYSSQQARVLVRTETTGGMNRGQQLARTDAGISKKRWVSVLDVRTRTIATTGKFDHLAANRQVTNNEGLFTVSGEKLLHPGDISNGASSGNVVQCRCVAVAHFDDDEDTPLIAPEEPFPQPPAGITYTGKPNDLAREVWNEIGDGVKTEADARRVGQRILDAALDDSRVDKAAVDTLRQQSQAWMAARKELQEATEARKRSRGAKRPAAEERERAARRSLSVAGSRLQPTAQQVDKQLGPVIREKLRLVRDFGRPAGVEVPLAYSGKETADLRAAIDVATDVLPRDWVNTLAVDSQRKRLTIKRVARGYFDAGSRVIGLSGDMGHTATHELAHWMGHVRRPVRGLCKEFLARRATGYALTKIAGDPGAKGWEDEFFMHYVGRDYGAGGDTEILSMAIERILMSPRYLPIWVDEDHVAFALGIIAGT